MVLKLIPYYIANIILINCIFANIFHDMNSYQEFFNVSYTAFNMFTVMVITYNIITSIDYSFITIRFIFHSMINEDDDTNLMIIKKNSKINLVKGLINIAINMIVFYMCAHYYKMMTKMNSMHSIAYWVNLNIMHVLSSIVFCIL